MAFPFYNTSAPSPSTKNSITNTATGLGYRDFLLNKNLLPQYPFLSTSINGGPRIGEPVLDTSINGNANVVPFGLPLETEGLLRYSIAILPNQYKDDEPTSPSLFDIEYIQKTQGVFGNVDFPQGIQSYPTTASQQVTQYGLFGKTNYAEFRKDLTLFNLYVDTAKQIDMADFISLQPAGFSQQLDSYLDVFGGLNGGGNAGVQAANIIGSILDGNGLGLAKGGVVTNYDVRASLVGRVLGATGLINDTKLGLIGGQQLALALANNAAFNIQEDLLGALNVEENVLSLIKTGNLSGFRPNYTITVPGSLGGRIADYTSRVLGFQVPISYLNEAGSIFLSESNSGNIERANSMILNTGKGQIQSLIANVNASLIGTTENDNPSTTPFRSGYVPGYLDNRGRKAINPNLYAFYDADKGTIYPFAIPDPNSVIPEISYNRSEMISKYGFKTPEESFTGPRTNGGYNQRKISDVGFSWTSTNGESLNSIKEGPLDFNDELVGDKKSLLVKTQKLFNSKGMKNIISVKGENGYQSSQITTANADGISRGSAVVSGDRYDESGFINSGARPEDTYCRSWTTLDRYDTVSKMVRNSGLAETSKLFGASYFRFQTLNSTLDSNGFVKIAPYIDDKYSVYDSKGNQTSISDPKNYMLSIENLAWYSYEANLPPVEVGPGDLITETKGRIMWFPPYNIQFNESSSVNWEATNFIGRGEPVYTYNNTERSASLSFSIIVDHSSYMNSFRGALGPSDNYVASFVAGCVEPNNRFAERLTVSEISSIVEKEIQEPQQQVLDTPIPDPLRFDIYYPNEAYDVNYAITSGYENGLDNNFNNGNSIIGTNRIDAPGLGYGLDFTIGQLTGIPYNDHTNFGLNGAPIVIDGVEYSGVSDINLYNGLSTYMNGKCKYCKITITSYANAQGTVENNQTLIEERNKSASNFLKTFIDGIDNRITTEVGVLDPTEAELCTDINDDDIGTCKIYRVSRIVIEYDVSLAIQDKVNPTPVVKKQNFQVNTKISNRFYNEAIYFEKLKQTDSFVFDNFRQKIRYFHPAFHSMTPEGLNSRLTFLQQCTRQGPTTESSNTNNLAFGRPPICILRIGDFFHTKVVIDNLSIDYEPLVWDLNPEGIGVQPMIANVTLSLKLIGGSSLMGPINKLQNALSFNYYANIHVYDPRADYIAIKDDLADLVKGKSIEETSQINDNIKMGLGGQYGLVNGEININKYSTSSVVSEEQIEPEIKQTEACDEELNAAAKKGPLSTPTTGTTEPEITSVKYVKLEPVAGENNTYDVTILLNQKNIFDENGDFILASFGNDNQKAIDYFNKGISFVLSQQTPQSNVRNLSATGTNFFNNKLIKYTSDLGETGLKSLFVPNAFGCDYFDYECGYKYRIQNLDLSVFTYNNQFTFELRYNGKRIQLFNFNLNYNAVSIYNS